MELQYAISEGYQVEEPSRGSEHAAGLDIYIPQINAVFLNDLREKNKNQNRLSKDNTPSLFDFEELESDELYVLGHSRIIIPTGLRFNIPEGTYLEVANRGSTAANKGLIFGAHIIDSDYTGIVFINLINTTASPVYFKSGERLIQLIHKEYIRSSLQRITENQIRATKRGSGALGSTGN